MNEESDYPNNVQEFYYKELGWCGCGSPQEALEFMRDILQIMKNRSDDNQNEPCGTRYEDSAWAKHTKLLDDKLPGALGLSYFYFLDSVGLTEHGGSIGGSWLTKDGERALEILRSHDLETALDE